MAIVQYTTESKIRTRIGKDAATLRTNDAALSMSQCIDDASVEVDGYLNSRYSQAALAASNWVELKTRHIAIWNACGRRLNPEPSSAQMNYDKAIADLEKVQAGKMNIPLLPERKESVPVISNVRIRQSRVPIAVVETGRSTGTAEGYDQREDQVEAGFNYDWGI